MPEVFLNRRPSQGDQEKVETVCVLGSIVFNPPSVREIKLTANPTLSRILSCQRPQGLVHPLSEPSQLLGQVRRQSLRGYRVFLFDHLRTQTGARCERRLNV